MSAHDIVTLYRVRRPDGTLIDKAPHSDKALAAATAWDELSTKDRMKADILGGRNAGLRLLWLLNDLGYVVEPIQYIPHVPGSRTEG